MRVLSLFDGISCARVALDRAGLPVSEYLACEIDKHAIAISANHYPDIVRLGDVREVYMSHLKGPIDLMIGGSPCQDLSIAKRDRRGLDGERSSLFWEYVRIKDLLRPKWFILENVASMPTADRDIITEAMGVEPVMINASLVSAQSRKRLFWTNIPQSGLPADRGLLLKDILEPDAEDWITPSSFTPTPEKATRGKTKDSFVQVGYVGDKNHCGVGGQALRIYDAEGKTPTLGSYGPLVATGAAIRGNIRTETPDGVVYRDTVDVRQDGKANSLTAIFTNKLSLVKVGHIGATDGQANRVYSPDGKSATLSANGGGSGAKTGLYQLDGRIRRLTPVECERLQGLPDGYTEGVAKTHRYKALGNGFNVDVIVHLLTPLRSLN
jgi:site-specific DNA-cytosine methylase